MKKLEFNNLDLILDWIKNPEHKDSLFLLECAIREAKGPSKSASAFNVGDKVSFGKPRGRRYYGVVEKLNPSKAVVFCQPEGKPSARWRVPYSMMEAA